MQNKVILSMALAFTFCHTSLGGRHDMPRPYPPPRAPKHLAPPSRRQRSNSFPRPTRSHAHHCSRLTRQHGGEQIGLVTLTFDLESCVRITCDVGYLCANFVFLGLSVLDLGPMYATQQTDVRQHHRLMPPPISLFVCLVFNNTFSTYRPYRATGV